MAKATLEFDLNDFDDRMAHLRAVKSLDMALALWEITHNTKKGLLYSLEDKNLSDWEVVDMVFKKIYEILDENGINTEELIN